MSKEEIKQAILKIIKENEIYESDYCIVGDIIKDLKEIINECNN